jgi:O-acetyl-ADP-ribose deacetylase
MKWILKAGNILDEPADVLICSANPHLTLSGGVGADLLARYGGAMHNYLQQEMRKRSPHFAPCGEIIPYTGAGLPYKAVLHAVAIDGWYDSSPAVITQVVNRALKIAAGYGARNVALTALATGFGHLTLAQFGEGLVPLQDREFPPIEDVRICLLEDYRVRELAQAMPFATVGA